MQDLIWDAVPAQRKRKEEKYNFAAITMSAIDKPGAGRKFSFNKAAQETLNIQGEDRVSFGFTADGMHIYIRKATGEAGFKLTKTCTLSDKRTYEFIAKRLGLNTEVETTFEVINADAIGAGVCELSLYVEPQHDSAFELETVDTEEVISDQTFDSDTYETAPIAELVEVEESYEDTPAESTEEDVW